MDSTLPQLCQALRISLLQRMAMAADDCLTDAELLELVLPAMEEPSAAAARSERLLAAFGSLSAILAAEAPALRVIDGMDDQAVDTLALLRLFLHRALRSQIATLPVIACWSQLLDYLRLTMGHEPIEQFRVLFLDHRHALLADEVMWRGTVNDTPAYPRESPGASSGWAQPASSWSIIIHAAMPRLRRRMSRSPRASCRPSPRSRRASMIM